MKSRLQRPTRRFIWKPQNNGSMVCGGAAEFRGCEREFAAKYGRVLTNAATET
jgi:hypothetical protein